MSNDKDFWQWDIELLFFPFPFPLSIEQNESRSWLDILGFVNKISIYYVRETNKNAALFAQKTIPFQLPPNSMVIT